MCETSLFLAFLWKDLCRFTGLCLHVQQSSTVTVQHIRFKSTFCISTIESELFCQIKPTHGSDKHSCVELNKAARCQSLKEITLNSEPLIPSCEAFVRTTNQKIIFSETKSHEKNKVFLKAQRLSMIFHVDAAVTERSNQHWTVTGHWSTRV